MAKCPVCGMDVNVEKTEQMARYEGITYYFCDDCCKTVFEEKPARYQQVLGG
ncbi:YHS domain-containing protein [Candidatus Desantisbacteria bacterium]|nr:YHS domain-containing protein [Candidatus Desantisbacteria bacterium]